MREYWPGGTPLKVNAPLAGSYEGTSPIDMLSVPLPRLRSDSDGAVGRSVCIYATSVPGMFAVGDVRSRSVKRVASAVGEGSVVISDVHRYRADHRNNFAAEPNSALAALRSASAAATPQN
jgi:hypothetical protein